MHATEPGLLRREVTALMFDQYGTVVDMQTARVEVEVEDVVDGCRGRGDSSRIFRLEPGTFRPQASEMASAGGVFEEVAAVDDSGRLRLQRRLRTTSGRRVVVLVLRTQLRVGAEPALSPGIALFGFTTLYETLDS